MLLDAIKTIIQAIIQLVLLGCVGFWLVKLSWIRESGLKVLSGLVIGFFLPLFMFSEIIKRFRFDLYPDWWVFPILSLLITAVGFLLGLLALAAFPTIRKNEGEF